MDSKDETASPQEVLPIRRNHCEFFENKNTVAWEAILVIMQPINRPAQAVAQAPR